MSKLTGIQVVDFGTPDLRLSGSAIHYWNGSDAFELVRTDTTDTIDNRVDAVYTGPLGLAVDATDLGTFTGSTISDNTDVVGALQELETALENNASGNTNIAYVTVTSASSATTAIVSNLPLGAKIVDARIRVDTAWDGTSPTISIGNTTDGNTLVAGSADFDLKTASSSPQVLFTLDETSATEDLNVYMTQDASTTGSALVAVTWVA